MAAPLWVTIPRCEETFERKNLAAASSARTVFVLEVHSKAGGGVTQTWSLNKRYGYFERIDRVASRFGPAPTLPRRRMLNHREPKYLASLREELQLYMERVVELVWSSTREEGVDALLQRLELPMASAAGTWEQDTTARFGAASGGRAQPVSLEGSLRKQGGSKRGKERGWKDRWFVLTGSSLHYYQHRDAPTPKGYASTCHQ